MGSNPMYHPMRSKDKGYLHLQTLNGASFGTFPFPHLTSCYARLA